MSISIERYVDIVSGVIGAQSVAQRELVGLRFTTNPKVPIDAVLTINDASDAVTYFGGGSPEALFAAQYFAYISPAPASQAQKLRFAAWPSAARAARIYGAESPASLTELQAVTSGTLNLTLNDTTEEITGINLSAETTLAEVAAELQVVIRAITAGGADWTTATVSYDALTGSFNLVGGATGDAVIDVEAATAGTDLSTLIGWRNVGTVLSPGSDAESPTESLVRVDNITDSFGSFSFGATVTQSQAVELATFNASLNVKYMYLQPVTTENAEDFAAALISIPSVGLVLNVATGEFKESLPAAIMAATNYQRQNATVNYMYRQNVFTPDVTTNAAADVYDALRVNYYGETASAGQKISFFQRAFLMGTATSPLDMNVHANEQWLKSFLTSRILSLFLSVNKIDTGNDGRGQIRAIVMEGVNLAKFNGTITIGKNLSTAQQIAVTQLTGDPDAWRDVQINGFWLGVAIVERTGESGATEYVAQYTLAYAKNDVVRKVEGSHNLV